MFYTPVILDKLKQAGSWPPNEKKQKSHRAWYRAAQIAFIAVIILAPLGFGGNNASWNSALAGIALLTTALLGWKTKWKAAHLSWVHVIILIGLFASIIQLIPIPIEWIKVLAPGTYNLLPVYWQPSDSPHTLTGLAWQPSRHH